MKHLEVRLKYSAAPARNMFNSLLDLGARVSSDVRLRACSLLFFFAKLVHAKPKHASGELSKQPNLMLKHCVSCPPGWGVGGYSTNV